MTMFKLQSSSVLLLTSPIFFVVFFRIFFFDRGFLHPYINFYFYWWIICPGGNDIPPSNFIIETYRVSK